MRKGPTIAFIAAAAIFGIVHDFGMLAKWLGPPDGNDHATAVLVAGGSSISARNVTVQATIVGDDLQVIPPRGPGSVSTSS